MKYNFNDVIDRSKNYSTKWSEMEDRFNTSDLLPMWIADMDIKSPDFVLDALHKRVDQAIFGYVAEPIDYHQIIANWIYNRFDFKVDPNSIMYSPKVVTSLGIIIQSLTKENDKVMVCQPVYGPFSSMVVDNNRCLVVSELKKDKDNFYTMDFDDIEKKIKGVSLFILCNPHNPVGRAWSFDELKRLSDICLKNNVLILSDEIHADLILPGNKHIPIASINKEVDNITITCMAPTKTFNLAGLHTSYIISSNKTLFDKIHNTLSILDLTKDNVFSLVATQACYTPEGELWLNELINHIDSNIDFVIEFFNENIPMLKLKKPQATYLAWVDASKLNMDIDTIQDAFINVGKIALNRGDLFGDGGDTFFRMNLACPKYILEDGLNRMKVAIDSLV